MTYANIWDFDQQQLRDELVSAEKYVREINRLLRKRQLEDFERFKIDQHGNPKRIKA